MSAPLPAVILGGSGYVAGELLRLLAQHPRLRFGGAVSVSRAGEPIASSFGHLATVYPEEKFASAEEILGQLHAAPHWVVLSAAPHGASAGPVDRLLSGAEREGVRMTVVDASADFRYASSEDYFEVYGRPHPAPERIGSFRCAVPEHLTSIDTPHAAQPGCFATAMLLGIVPLLALGLSEPEFYVSALTGSTGAGRTPRDTTHHPMRQSNVFAYQPLQHRHDPEVRALAQEATGREMALHFVPHSGPFARGIQTTLFARRTGAHSATDIAAALSQYYDGASFIRVAPTPPRLKDVVGTNNAVLSASADQGAVAICCVLDNLVKGAAGGSIQWMNRLLGWPETEGLTIAPAGWV